MAEASWSGRRASRITLPEQGDAVQKDWGFTTGRDLPAPKLMGVVHSDSERTQETQAELDGAPPADAVALVIFDARHKAKSWGTVAANATTIEVYGQHKCDVLPNGTLASKAGDKVMLAWVDKYGRLSAKTKLFTITAKK
jgi:hypothetical protein